MEIRARLQPLLQQRMHLSQQMLQNLELLQMPLIDLRDYILKELEENPALEERQDVEDPEESPAPAAEEETPEEAARREALEAVEEEWAESERRTRRSDSAEEAERRAERLANLAAPSVSLRDHLAGQLAFLPASTDLRAYCDFVIENVDENGYLPPTEELVASLPQELRGEAPEILCGRVERAVSIIQSLDPRGVGARSLKECLLLQLDPGDPCLSVLRVLIERHLEDLGANRIPQVAHAVETDPEASAWLGYDPAADPPRWREDLTGLLAVVAALDPKPGGAFSADLPARVYPEVIIREVDGRYEVMLEDGWLPPVSLNRSYVEVLRGGGLSKGDRHFLRSRLEAGRKLITAIEQRRRTIYRIVTEILKRQGGFFEKGVEQLRPLKMQEVADTLGIHLSTVSRAIRDKWVETPRGVLPLKFFFASAAPAAPLDAEWGRDETRLGLMEKIREIVEAEDKKRPLSDLEIVRKLRDVHRISAARRTVAKYREEIDVPPSSLRRVF